MDSKLDDTSKKDPKSLILDEFRSGKRLSRIGISFLKGTITLSFPGPFPSPTLQIFYTEKSENLSEIGLTNNPKSLQRGNFRDLAVDDMIKILTGPGDYKLENLTIAGEIDNLFAQKLSEKFENHSKIHVDSVQIYMYGSSETAPVNNLLNLFQSIKEIDIKSKDLPDEEFTDKLKGITALKNVEMVTIHNTRNDHVFWDPARLMIPRFTVKLDRISVHNYVRMMKALVESPHLEYCHVIGDVRRSIAFEKGLNKCGVRNDPPNSDIYKCPIPDSNDYFEIKFTRKLGLRVNRLSVRRPRIIYAFTDIERKSNAA